MSLEKQILTNMANGKIDLARQFLSVGELNLSKRNLADAIRNIEMIQNLAPDHQLQPTQLETTIEV